MIRRDTCDTYHAPPLPVSHTSYDPLYHMYLARITMYHECIMNIDCISYVSLCITSVSQCITMYHACITLTCLYLMHTFSPGHTCDSTRIFPTIHSYHVVSCCITSVSVVSRYRCSYHIVSRVSRPYHVRITLYHMYHACTSHVPHIPTHRVTVRFTDVPDADGKKKKKGTPILDGPAFLIYPVSSCLSLMLTQNTPSPSLVPYDVDT